MHSERDRAYNRPMDNTNLHAHVSTTVISCDGRYYSDHSQEMTKAERADDQGGDIDFMGRVLALYCNPFAVEVMKIEVTEEGFNWREPSDEGGTFGEVRWCRREFCNH